MEENEYKLSKLLEVLESNCLVCKLYDCSYEERRLLRAELLSKGVVLYNLKARYVSRTSCQTSVGGLLNNNVFLLKNVCKADENFMQNIILLSKKYNGIMFIMCINKRFISVDYYINVMRKSLLEVITGISKICIRRSNIVSVHIGKQWLVLYKLILLKSRWQL